MSFGPARATFVIRGSRPVTVEVHGAFDASASVGFRAVAASLIRDEHVTIDLTRCDSVDEVAAATVAAVASRIETAGGTAAVRWGAASCAGASA